MFLLRRIVVGDNGRVLVFRRNRFVELLGPGEYWRFGVLTLERHNLSSPVFASEAVDYLVTRRPDLVAMHLVAVETGDLQVAIVFVDGKLFRVVGPGSRVLFWRGYREITAELVNVRETPEIDKDRILALQNWGANRRPSSPPSANMRPGCSSSTTVSSASSGPGCMGSGRCARPGLS